MENIKMTYIHYFVRTKGGLNWGIEANDNLNRNTTCLYIVYTYLHWSICQWNRYCSVATGNPPNFPLLLLPYHSCIVMISCASLAGLTLLFISCGNRREVLMNLYVIRGCCVGGSGWQMKRKLLCRIHWLELRQLSFGDCDVIRIDRKEPVIRMKYILQ